MSWEKQVSSTDKDLTDCLEELQTEIFKHNTLE